MSERQASSGQAQRAAREKSRQSSLADAQAQADKPDNIDRMVAQAFDSDPKIRLRVAEELGRVDDPRAIFALVELSSDKEEPVKLAAQRSLEKFKKEEGDAIVSLEKLFAERKEIKKPEEIPEVRLKMMPTLEKLFSHYEPKKRESAKRKLMPSLQKLFGFGPVYRDPLHEIEPISQPHPQHRHDEERPEPESGGIPAKDAENFPFGENRHVAKKDSVEIDDRDEADDEEPDRAEGRDEGSWGLGQDENEPHADGKYFELAYRIATTPGMGKAELKREQARLVNNFKKDVGLAFRMAESRAKEDGLANFSNLKPGMKNLSFSQMQIISISDVDYGSRKKHFARCERRT